jgi:hypothetical protein
LAELKSSESIEIEAAKKFIAADLGDGVVSARTMMKQAKHLALTELRFLLHGLVCCCNEGMHFRYAFGKFYRHNPI